MVFFFYSVLIDSVLVGNFVFVKPPKRLISRAEKPCDVDPRRTTVIDDYDDGSREITHTAPGVRPAKIELGPPKRPRELEEKKEPSEGTTSTNNEQVKPNDGEVRPNKKHKNDTPTAGEEEKPNKEPKNVPSNDDNGKGGGSNPSSGPSSGPSEGPTGSSEGAGPSEGNPTNRTKELIGLLG